MTLGHSAKFLAFGVAEIAAKLFPAAVVCVGGCQLFIGA